MNTFTGVLCFPDLIYDRKGEVCLSQSTFVHVSAQNVSFQDQTVELVLCDCNDPCAAQKHRLSKNASSSSYMNFMNVIFEDGGRDDCLHTRSGLSISGEYFISMCRTATTWLAKYRHEQFDAVQLEDDVMVTLHGTSHFSISVPTFGTRNFAVVTARGAEWHCCKCPAKNAKTCEHVQLVKPSTIDLGFDGFDGHVLGTEQSNSYIGLRKAPILNQLPQHKQCVFNRIQKGTAAFQDVGMVSVPDCTCLSEPCNCGHVCNSCGSEWDLKQLPDTTVLFYVLYVIHLLLLSAPFITRILASNARRQNLLVQMSTARNNYAGMAGKMELYVILVCLQPHMNFGILILLT